MLRGYSLFVILLLTALSGFSQYGESFKKPRYVAENLPYFDTRVYHFGFIIGVNGSTFRMDRVPQTNFNDSLISLNNQPMPGFNLGIVTTYAFTKNFRIRFVPSLSFQDRKLVYQFRNKAGNIATFEKITESTFIELPVYLKFRTDRIGNAAPYIIAGAKYMIDMSHKTEDPSSNDRDILIKLEKFQTAAEFGGGFDFFLPYFKFGIELKMAVGLEDYLMQDNTRFSTPIQKLFPTSYFLTFTFEG
ncbi:type IX secretion/gliding motility protein PorT/SprT [Luteibaculum oceani]|uniref:PorT family protein n=1 Tax=Luteibaculum oceani TaxID=1294296 RepID=A0A5C6V4A9_9FLAO|nr:outer membrane beta-barrel protein [Luteibaculum oceani]TXC78548.1 PorT family protein [Luteibaculum oceani]